MRAAAKNFRDVLVVVSPDDYATVLTELDRETGPALSFRFDLARRAFAHTGAYDTAIAATLGEISVERRRVHTRIGRARHWRPSGWSSRRGSFATCDTAKIRTSRRRGTASRRERALGAAAILQGKELSFTNLLDLDAAARIVLEFGEPAACVIKHTNPCGAATGDDIAEAYTRARDADALAAFGGIVGLNRPIDAADGDARSSRRSSKPSSRRR